MISKNTLIMDGGLARRGEKQFPLLPGHFSMKGILKRAKSWQKSSYANVVVDYLPLSQKEPVHYAVNLKASHYVLLMGTMLDFFLLKNNLEERPLGIRIPCGGVGSVIIT